MGRINNAVFSGKGGSVYVDGVRVAYIESINVKVTGEFEDLELCGTYEKEHVYTGFDNEGEMVVVKVDTSYDEDTMESFKTGAMPGHTIVTRLTNPNTNKTSNYTIRDVTYTEITPVEIKKGAIKQTIPFKCSMPEKLK